MQQKQFLQELRGISNNIDYYARYISKRTKLEFDDARQELFMKLVVMNKSYTKYDASRAKASTFLIVALKRYTSTIIKSQYRMANPIMHTRAFFDQEEHLLEEDRDCYSVVDNKHAYKDYVVRIVKELKVRNTKNALPIFKLLLQNDTISNISKQLNIPVSWCSRIVKTQIRPIVQKIVQQGPICAQC